jgi:uracil-DNA glycosylase family 4
MRATYVPPSGPPDAKMAIVGEQPGYMEVRKGEPFVGPAGMGLDECMQMAKIPRHEVYLTNVIKDADKPLSSYINLRRGQQYTITDAGADYIHELQEELTKLPLNIVVACGNVPLIALTNRVGITKWRGSVIESTIIPKLKVLPTFHPATFIPPKFNFLNKPLITNDLIHAKYQSEFHELERTERSTKIEPTFAEAIGALNHCYEVGTHGRTIDIDIEVINEELDCIAFAWAPDKAICIPFRDGNGDYFTVSQEHEIMLLISKIIESPFIPKRGANFIFDMQFMFHKYGMIPRGELHCTQIAQKIAFPDFPAGLDFVTTMHTDIPYYKDDGKKWMKRGIGGYDKWWTYNAMDSIATSAAHPHQMAELSKQHNVETYHRQRLLIKPLIYMSERGIRVNVSKMADYSNEQQVERDKLIEKFHKLVGRPLNPNSPKDLMEFFYKECRIQPYKKRNAKGKYVKTTDVDAMKRIARRTDITTEIKEAAQTVLDIRNMTKRISTYLNIGKIDKDGRYRSSYKPVGAETGRLASGETIFGTGGNQQNWPHDLLRFFEFDSGYIGYSIDLSQIENRIVAYTGGVIEQIKAFESGIDLHTLTASVIFSKPYEEISGKDGSSSLGDGRQSERFWGKKGNHATNYDVGYKTFALKNEMPESVAKAVLAKVHLGYPQIRNGYHQRIQKMLFKNRIVTNLFGRNRLFLGPIHQTGTTPKSACLDTFRKAYAHFAQSTCADKINEQGVEFIYYNPDPMFKPVELLTQIHDSVVFQIPLSVPWLQHADVILAIKASLETLLTFKSMNIYTPADLCIGLNMCKDDMVEIKSKNIPTSSTKLAEELERVYGSLRAKLA